MSNLHLSAGSTKPPLVDGKLRLYSMLYCPYAERVRIVLEAKNVPYDVVNVNLRDKPDWLFGINPSGKVPVLDTGKRIILESLDICYYLDELYPEPALIRKEYVEEDRMIIKKFDDIIKVFYACAWTKEKSLAAYIDDMRPILDELEAKLSARGKFFGGNEPSMVDYMLWPWAERAEVLGILHDTKIPVDSSKYPNIFSWCAAMKSIDCIRKTIISIEKHHRNMMRNIPYDEI